MEGSYDIDIFISSFNCIFWSSFFSLKIKRAGGDDK